jgi:hypothetical protein
VSVLTGLGWMTWLLGVPTRRSQIFGPTVNEVLTWPFFTAWGVALVGACLLWLPRPRK